MPSEPEQPEAAPSAARCQVEGCANRVACFGTYEGDGVYGFGCDEHCGHGCEDGICVELQFPKHAALIQSALDARDRSAREQAIKDERERIAKAMRVAASQTGERLDSYTMRYGLRAWADKIEKGDL